MGVYCADYWRAESGAGGQFQWQMNFWSGTCSSIRKPDGWQGLCGRSGGTVFQLLSGYGFLTQRLSILGVSSAWEPTLGHWVRHLPEASYPDQFQRIQGQCHLIVCPSNAACSVCDHRYLAPWWVRSHRGVVIFAKLGMNLAEYWAHA